MKITAVRHGETLENAAGIIQGQTQGTLSPAGIAQTQALGNKLAAVQFDVMYSSDLQRCKDTSAAILAHHPHLQPVYDERLRERDMHPDEGKAFGELEWDYADNTRLDHKTAEGESWFEVAARLKSFVEEVLHKHQGQHVLFVTHSGSLRVLDSILGNLPLEQTIQHAYENCAVREWELA